MKAFLMYRDRDFNLQSALPWNERDLTQDLELETLLDAMSREDEFLHKVARIALLTGCGDQDRVLYRQAVLRDCLANVDVVWSLYALAVEAIEAEKKTYWGLAHYPMGILHRSVDVLIMLVEVLKKLRGIADTHAEKFSSEGFRTLFAMLQRELGDEYFETIQAHLKTLKFRHGVLISARLGMGNKGEDYVLRQPNESGRGWFARLLAKKPLSHTFTLHPRDEAGARALSELGDRGINLVANALAQSTGHILSFLIMLRIELAFYVSCLNLHETLTQKGEPTAFPVPVPAGERAHAFHGLYDVCLALHLPQRVVGNDVEAGDRSLVVITGANQGGKSTFLRSIGLSQLMMECGMFVAAESYTANLCGSLCTHYKREEDTTMKSGKLDEELARMSELVDHIVPDGLILFNESFAATNEREGSDIAGQITRALLDYRVKVFTVTHMYEFADSLHRENRRDALYLRAQRQEDGKRTFRLVEAEPLETSYGADLYEKIFGPDAAEQRGANAPPPTEKGSTGPTSPINPTFAAADCASSAHEAADNQENG